MGRGSRGWRLRVLALTLLVAGCSAGPAEAPAPPGTPPAAPATPDGAAITAALEQAIGSGSVTLQTLDTVLVNVDGRPVVTHYRHGRTPDQTQHVFSVTKSVLSALVGIALDEGVLEDLDAPLRELLPSRADAMDDEVAAVTLRQLVTMTAGLPDDDTDPSAFADPVRSDSAVDAILRRGLVEAPGTGFTYSNASAHLVSAVLTEALRRADGARPRSVLDYASEKLFAPLGVDTRDPYEERFDPDRPGPFLRAGFGWATDAEGINIGGGNLRLRPADLLAFGQLYLDGGRWQGRQVVGEEWVAASGAPGPTGDRYGQLWWRERTPAGAEAIAARGFGGQLVLVVGARRAVVVVTATPAEDYASDSDDVLALVSQVVLPALGG